MNVVLAAVLRLLLVVVFPFLMIWTIAGRLCTETRSTLFYIRCDVLERLHYFRLAWREVPKQIKRGRNA